MSSLKETLQETIVLWMNATGRGLGKLGLPSVVYVGLAAELGIYDANGEWRPVLYQTNMHLFAFSGEISKEKTFKGNVRIGRSFIWNSPWGAVTIEEVEER